MGQKIEQLLLKDRGHFSRKVLHAAALYFQQRQSISRSWVCFGKIEIARIKQFLEKRLGVDLVAVA